MAKLEYSYRKADDDAPISLERIEVRPWGLGGRSDQEFVISSGSNSTANSTIWLEISYSVNEVQFFHTRNFLHLRYDEFSVTEMEELLEKFKDGEQDSYSFVFILPETAIRLGREKFQYCEDDHEEKTSISYFLEIAVDVSAVMGGSAPGMRMINIKINRIKLEQGIQFMRDLTREIADVYVGKHPNPADLLQGSGDWHFVRQLNQKAYDRISEDYQERYFSNPSLVEAFDAWLSEMPASGHILDAGCGHGQPVISRLLEKGFTVTGIDLSPKMLERARDNFPDVKFVNQMTSEITYESEFDGACSLSSLLYLDPIDLSRSIYRLYRALKPGGLLFLYAYDQHPTWRGVPYHFDLHEWMWAWTYSMQEAVKALEEHGCFKVLKMQDVTTEIRETGTD